MPTSNIITKDTRASAEQFLVGRNVDTISKELGMIVLGRLNDMNLDGELPQKIGEVVISYLVAKYQIDRPN